MTPTRQLSRRRLLAGFATVVALAGCGGSDDAQGSGIVEGLPGGAGTPAIFFTSVPAFGTFADLHGRVLHVDAAQFRVAVFIFVPGAGGWWTKPYFNQPLTAIRSDGTWTCDVTTGGIDERATAYAAFVVPNGYPVPLVAGSAALPAALDTHAVASVSITR